jgi:hypothetical protein
VFWDALLRRPLEPRDDVDSRNVLLNYVSRNVLSMDNILSSTIDTNASTIPVSR